MAKAVIIVAGLTVPALSPPAPGPPASGRQGFTASFGLAGFGLAGFGPRAWPGPGARRSLARQPTAPPRTAGRKRAMEAGQ